MRSIIGAALLALTVLSSGQAATLSVGAGKTYATPSLAAAAAQDGDTVEIAAGTYSGDVAVWRASHLTIRGVGGRPVLKAQGRAAEQKAIWVIKGDDTEIDAIEFTGAAVPDHNGAGIRQEGRNLTLKRCFFHDNEDGILAGDSPDSDILIENCEFDHNGQGDGRSHNMYINHVHSFTLRGCYSHNANIGHDVKSRALTNYILYNRISDDDASNTSYLIDFPNGGACYVIGNILRRGPNASQGILISFGEEGGTNPQPSLAVVNNTFAGDNTRHAVAFVQMAASTHALRVLNNLLLGTGTLLAYAPDAKNQNLAVGHNIDAKASDFRDAMNFDFHLVASSAAIDAGTDPGNVGGFDLTPRFQYVSSGELQPRPANGALDVGAYEWYGKF